MTKWDLWREGWLEIADGLVKIFTLGRKSTSFAFGFVLKCAQRDCLRMTGKPL
jgi:hypothetical protein